MALPGEINLRHTISERKFAVAGETIEHQGESLITLDITRTFEKLIEGGTQ